MKKNTSVKFLAVTILSVMILFGFKIQPPSFTDFYYYQGKPFKLTLKSDAIFIKLNDDVTQTSFENLISNFPALTLNREFNVKDKKDFVLLDEAKNLNELKALIDQLNQRSEVSFSSVAFSPDKGKTLIGSEDEIIVQFKPNKTDIEINNYIFNNNLKILQELSLQGGKSYVLKVNKSDNPIEMANRVYESGMVNWSEPNLFFTNLICYTPNDPFYPSQWSIKNTGNNIPGGISGTPGCDMRVDSAWDISLGISAVIISISDTGCDTLHADLAANFIPGTGYNFYNNTPGGFDDAGHGTCCAGIVAAVGNNGIGISGIAPNCKLLPVKWMNSSGSGNYTGATNATIYSYQKGAWIISNSWGFVGGSSSALDQAIADAKNLGRNGKGTLFVVASGNENGTMRYPAISNPNVLVVGGISPCNQRKSPSSCDNETFWGASYGANMDIVAPCVKIYATDITGTGGYSTTDYLSTFNGTSSATPNTAGVCALVLSVDSTLTWDSVRVRIGITADRVGSYTYNQPGPRNIGQWNNEMGYGKVNAYKALIYTLQMMGPTISHTPLPNTEQISGTYGVNCTITPNGGSSLISSELKLLWSKDNPGITDSVVLTPAGGNNFTGNIVSTGAGTYRYYLKAMDDLNRTTTLPFGAPANLFSFVAAIDNIPPQITHTPLGNQPLIRWPASVSANVTDNIGVGNVICEYSINSGAITGSFPMPLESGSTYKGTFNVNAGLLNVGDIVQYRIKATDASSQNNEGFHPSSGYHSFTIIETKGIVLVVDDDVSLSGRYSDQRMSVPDLETPLGASSVLFNTTLTDAGYVVDNVTFANLNVNTLNDYDIVILSAGVKESAMFSDAAKRTAIVNYTLAGGKTLVEGGEVGYIYRYQTTEVDANFRRNVLNDSSWVSDAAGQNIFFKMPAHPIYNDPNVLTGSIAVSNSSGNGWGARDAMRILPNKPGVKKVGTWSTLQDSASIIVHYKDNDTTQPRNIFLAFSVAQITDQNVAKQLIENAVWILSPENIVPVELVSFTATVTENNVTISWVTATELNNSGFSIERRTAGDLMYQSVGFVQGRGTTTGMSSYTFTDKNLKDGSYIYRLKQIDFDGSFEYSGEINVDITAPAVYALEQNHPNPFNPSTLIRYSIPQDGMVNLAVYNLLGEKIATLVNEVQKAGRHEISFDASLLASGIYFYRIEAGSFTSVKKMLLLK
jgi:subtilisin family serine protease